VSRWARVVGVAAWLFAGCHPAPEGEELSVFAAASLAEAFADLEQAFEADHPGVDVRVTTAGSQVLRLHIEQGAPADVFASADATHAEALAEAGHLDAPEVFAGNELVVVVPADDPRVQRFADLATVDAIVLGTPSVPAGRYARQALQAAEEAVGEAVVGRIRRRVVSEESNVRLVRAKVELGEADAALVYRTDAIDRPGLRVVPLPEAVRVPVELYVGSVHPSGHARAAAAFVQLLQSDRGQALLQAHGLHTP